MTISTESSWRSSPPTPSRARRPLHGATVRAPNLRWLHTFSAGTDHPVFGALRERGVRVTSSSGASAAPDRPHGDDVPVGPQPGPARPAPRPGRPPLGPAPLRRHRGAHDRRAGHGPDRPRGHPPRRGDGHAGDRDAPRRDRRRAVRDVDDRPPRRAGGGRRRPGRRPAAHRRHPGHRLGEGDRRRCVRVPCSSTSVAASSSTNRRWSPHWPTGTSAVPAWTSSPPNHCRREPAVGPAERDHHAPQLGLDRRTGAGAVEIFLTNLARYVRGEPLVNDR